MLVFVSLRCSGGFNNSLVFMFMLGMDWYDGRMYWEMVFGGVWCVGVCCWNLICWCCCVKVDMCVLKVEEKEIIV